MLALAAAGCGAEVAGAPEPGQYVFQASHPLVGGAPSESVHVSGYLILDETSPESLQGHWEVDRYASSIEPAMRIEQVYELHASPTYGGTAVHRIWRVGEPEELGCEGYYSIVLESGEAEVPLRCDLRPAEEANFREPGSAGPIIRRIDEDTVPDFAE